ncbi:RagB/SusD family nutrient uptake outer membrane protein [Sphingobacterium suaedae]|uniref:RagB/SusD family nutrient uptake outer membrane protein n=1 Tax=Sphingobacterium suaedae TaxID=1686402 RepID=A0ABW5KCW2_9SPHI
MKHIIISIVLSAWLIINFAACDDFLSETPKGSVFEEQLETPENIEKLVITTYSALGNEHFQQPLSPWPYGNLRSGDAYKGGAGTGDMGDFHLFETFVYMRDNVGMLDRRWYQGYKAISRANTALEKLNVISNAELPTRDLRIAEVRFLRAHFYFDLKILFKHIPYVDETISVDEYKNISNRELTDKQGWEYIIQEFRYAADILKDPAGEIGRINKWMAKAYLAKALLYAAYEQDEKNNVINIDKGKLEEVVSLTDEIIASGRYNLADNFEENFLWETQNGKESIFAIQYSVNDGTMFGRLDFGAMLNYPMNSEYGCCGFHSPSQNLVNSFKTDNNGLPLFDSFNAASISTPSDLQNNNIDPRLLHSVAIPDMPYKYKPDFIFKESWTRQPETYGAFMSLKEVVLPDCPCFKKLLPFMSSSKNRDIIRFDDMLLWRAEALIELDRPAEALPIINTIRKRAAQSTTRLVDIEGKKTGKFVVEEYKPGVNSPVWDKSFATKALRWERRLEMALEGYRFFDLVRWGIAAETVNEYFAVEKTRRQYLNDAKFTKNRDEYFPIPKSQIDFSKKLYQQNYGW